MRIPRPIAARPATRRSAGHRLVAAVATAAATVLATLIPSAPAAHAAVTKVETTVEIRCASTIMNASADWYLPGGTPKGLVWLQHGFFRQNDNVTDLAGRYADANYVVFAPTLPWGNIFGCTLQNIGNNTEFLANVADLFGKSQDPADKLGRSFARAKAAAGRPELSIPANMVFSGHSAGGEAVAFVGGYVKSNYPAAAPRLRGLVLLDPVKSIVGNNLTTGLNALNATGTPVKTVSGPDGTCNNSGSGTDLVQALIHRPFVGVRIIGGAHTDAEGASTDATGTLTCGTPQAANVAILQTLAVNWARDSFDGTTTAAYYPGGTYYQGLLTTNKIETLTGAP